jgi:plastocyanin
MKPYLIPCFLLSAMTFACAEDHLVEQKTRLFTVTEITIKPGDKIVFKNSDEVTHNVFSVSPINPFNLRVQVPGASSSIEFKDLGTTEVRCAIHPGMKLLVTVKN